MINYSNAVLNYLTVHRITDSRVELSKDLIEIEDQFLKEILIKYFFQGFNDDLQYCFDADNENVVYKSTSKIFEKPEDLQHESAKLAEHLFSVSQPETIKSGDLFTFYAEDCVLDDEIVEVVGLIKAENKNTYLKIQVENEHFDVGADSGIDINKIDKGALIFNTAQDQGYVILTIDNVNRKNTARYWNEEFLGVRQLNNEFFETSQLVNLCQDFIEQTIPAEEKLDKISLFNSSIDYLNSNDSYSHESYKEEVLEPAGVATSFDDYLNDQTHLLHDDTESEIHISKSALKQSKKYIRSVLKLDKNFHVYVHGNRENIERGFDPSKQKSYYKLFFEEEK